MGPARRARIVGISVAVWSFVGVVYGALLYEKMRDEGMHHTLFGVVRWQLAVWGSWTLLTPLLWGATLRWPIASPRRGRRLALHAALGLLVAAAHCVFAALALRALPPENLPPPAPLLDAVAANLRTRGPVAFLLAAGIVGGAHWWIEARRARQRARAALALEAELARARLHALKLQLHPHFLFNALHAAAGLVRQGRGDDAVDMIGALSDLLRYVLENGEKSEVTLAEEIDFAGRYLGIQRRRFEGRMNVEIDLEGGVGQLMVPNLVLLPLVENAVVHGVSGRPGGGRVAIRARRAGERLRIEVFDDGPPFDEDASGDRRVGLRNTAARLELSHGEGAGLELENVEGGVVAAVTLPLGGGRRA